MIAMTRWPAISLGVGVAAVAIVVWWSSCRPTPTPIPRREQRSIDSLDATRPAFDSSRNQTVRVESVYVAQSAAHRAQAIRSARVADSLRDVAIAWQRAAEAQGDTLSRWYQVAKTRELEVDSLRVANVGLLAALEDETRARTAADARAVLDSSRLAATERLNAGLARDLAAADPPCRALPFVKCPSRKLVAVVGLGLGVVATLEYDRNTKRSP